MFDGRPNGLSGAASASQEGQQFYAGHGHDGGIVDQVELEGAQVRSTASRHIHGEKLTYPHVCDGRRYAHREPGAGLR